MWDHVLITNIDDLYQLLVVQRCKLTTGEFLYPFQNENIPPPIQPITKAAPQSSIMRQGLEYEKEGEKKHDGGHYLEQRIASDRIEFGERYGRCTDDILPWFSLKFLHVWIYNITPLLKIGLVEF